MKYQALLLSLVILASLLISPVRNSISNGVSPVKNMAVEKPKSVELPKIKVSAPSVMSRFGENLLAIKIILANGLDTIFSQPPKADIKPESNITTSDVVISDVLISQSNINNNGTFPCEGGDLAGFTSQAILVKKIKQYFSADQTIFQLNPEKRWPIASLTKLMSSLIALEKMDPEKEIILSEKAVSGEGTVGDFKIGEVFKVDDLIKAMLVSSSNDAAISIAENFKNGESDFVNEMQKKASQLKMFSTTYLEPTGLSFVNQSTTNDLAKLVDYIYFEHPEIFEISRQKQAEILELKTNKSRMLIATDKFAGENDFIGGKTGYIEAAGRNLIAIFDINGRTILTITLGAEDAFKETAQLKDLVKDCQ